MPTEFARAARLLRRRRLSGLCRGRRDRV